jgi:hypothetical protein
VSEIEQPQCLFFITYDVQRSNISNSNGNALRSPIIGRSEKRVTVSNGIPLKVKPGAESKGNSHRSLRSKDMK